MQSQQISAHKLFQKINAQEPLFLLDVRNPEEYQIFNLGGYLLPLAQLPQRYEELPRDIPIILYCHSGYRSQLALEFLQSVGFNSLSNLIGGVLAWQKMCELDIEPEPNNS